MNRRDYNFRRNNSRNYMRESREHSGSELYTIKQYAKDLMIMDMGPKWENRLSAFVSFLGETDTNQIRKFYDYLLELDKHTKKGDATSIKKSLIKAKINILYASNRLKGKKYAYLRRIHDFYAEILNGIDFDNILDETEKLERLVTIFEAIVAYSRGA